MSVFLNLSEMNYFGVDGLPDEMILHLASFCAGSDLLNLSVTSQRLNQLLGTSQEMISKIQLVIDGYELKRLDVTKYVSEISKFALTRKFKSLKIIGLQKLYSNGSFLDDFLILMKTVMETSVDVIIEKSRFEHSTFEIMIGYFQFYLDELHFENCWLEGPFHDDFVFKLRNGSIYFSKGQETEEKAIERCHKKFLQGSYSDTISFLRILFPITGIVLDYLVDNTFSLNNNKTFKPIFKR